MTPIKRLREAVEQFGRAGTLVVETDDLRALLALVEAAQGIDADRDALCLAIGRLDGRDDHDWSAWGESYEGANGWWRDRQCQRCGVCESDPVPSPADDLRDRVLLANLSADPETAVWHEDADPGDEQRARGGEAVPDAVTD